jgi:N-acetylneuraminic acid mutarotase
MSQNHGSTQWRNSPDVALTAAQISVWVRGSPYCVEGTSAAAPLWAGLTAVINQQALESGGPPVGFLNPALYAIGTNSTKYARDFHDITNGNNTNAISPTNFYAVVGYDLCTGWGTPAGTNLINDLALSGACLMSNVGSLNTGRGYHTATLLTNGWVLVAGGQLLNGTVTASAELYNPATGTWTNTGSLNTPRAFHTATLLQNGMVLVAGGANPGSPLGSAELYNPSTQEWSYTAGPLNTARAFHTATLLSNGLVLVAGGLGTNAGGSCGNQGDVAVDSGQAGPMVAGTNDVLLPNAEIYNPATGDWTNTACLNTARAYHTATILTNGAVLVAGGYGASETVLTNAEVYNPHAAAWTNTGSMSYAREFHTATLFTNGLVLVAGGLGASGTTIPKAELYNPAAGGWTLTGPLNTAREEQTASLLANGLVLVTGGESSSLGVLGTSEEYNPGTGEWTWTCSLNTARYAHTATVLTNESVLLAGGAGQRGPGIALTELYP